jgi:hypothetical protein
VRADRQRRQSCDACEQLDKECHRNFDGPAARTVQFIAALNIAGGKAVIAVTIENVRGNYSTGVHLRLLHWVYAADGQADLVRRKRLDETVCQTIRAD